MASASTSMAERQKKRKLTEARQAGTLAPEVDADGVMVNPHNPEFITKRPWYLGEGGGGVKHQSKQKETHFLSLTETEDLVQVERSLQQRKKRARASGYRKGACRNCGSMTHKEKDCLERPRSNRSAAWKSGLDIADDDVRVELTDHGKLAYDAKRDAYKGFDVDHHQRMLQEQYERLETERRLVRAQEREAKRRSRQERRDAKVLAKALKKKEKEKAEATAEAGAAGDDAAGVGAVGAATPGSEEKKAEASDSDSDSSGSSGDSDSDSDNEDFLAKDDQQKDFQGRVARQGGLGGAQMATTVRNLRVREDTAKYLLNLDPNSAYYDPKSRAMRDNPLPHLDPSQLVYAGDNFVRANGDTSELARTQIFAWSAEERGNDIHLQAAPSQAELARKHHEAEKTKLEDSRKKAIAEKYGVAKGTILKPMDARLALGQTEVMTEYTPDGRLVKGPQAGPAVSKYEEDVCPGNHTSVWGSWYDVSRRVWGFRCCHSTNRHSYCTGEAGKAAQEASELQRTGGLLAQKKETLAEAAEQQTDDQRAAAKARAEDAARAFKDRSQRFGDGDGDVELDPEKLKAAVDRARRDPGGKPEGYNSRADASVTAEEMEAYRMVHKHRGDDPMAKFAGDSDEVLPVD